jgi:hypothetical protein
MMRFKRPKRLWIRNATERDENRKERGVAAQNNVHGAGEVESGDDANCADGIPNLRVEKYTQLCVKTQELSNKMN